MENTQGLYFQKRIDLDDYGKGAHMLTGDINGDGRLEMIFVQTDSGFDDRYFSHSVVCATCVTLEGDILWQIGTKNPDAVNQNANIPCQIYDIDNDSSNEFVCVIDKELCIFDGMNANLKKKFPLPSLDAHDAIIFADLEGKGYAQNIILKSKYHQLFAMDSNFNPLWSYTGNVGHFPWPYDIDRDGKDELIAGNTILNGEGNVLWNVDVSSHINAICVCDLKKDKSFERVIVLGGRALQAFTPQGELLKTLDGVTNVRSIYCASFFPESPYLQLAVVCHYKGEESLLICDNELNVAVSISFPHSKNARLFSVKDFADIKGEYILAYPGNGQSACIFDYQLNLLYTMPFDARVCVVDITGEGYDDIILYDSNKVEIYSVKEHNITQPTLLYTRPQQKKLYNSSFYSSGESIDGDYRLCFATGDFKSADVYTWATNLLLNPKEADEEIITRADFTVLLVMALDKNAHDRENFNDVYPTDYFASAVATVKKLGIVDNILGKFNPYAPMSAECATDMIKKSGYECFCMKEGDLTKHETARILLELIRQKNA